MLGPLLYLLYTADLTGGNKSIIATFEDDSAILATHNDPAKASQKLQAHFSAAGLWLTKWNIKIYGSKSTYITFATMKSTCPPVTLNGYLIPQTMSMKYLGMHLERRVLEKIHSNKEKRTKPEAKKIILVIRV